MKKGWNTQRNVGLYRDLRHFITETKKVAVALFETISNTGDCFNFGASRETIRRRRYGVIDAMDGRVVSIRFRLWPKIVTLPEVLFLGERYHERRRADRCRVYFNQPWRFPTYLAVPYGLCGRGTRLATMNAALVALDEIARIKRTDALLADVLNFRISPRMLARYGWESHKPSRWHRHFIKRFYGEYPPTRVPSDELAAVACDARQAQASCFAGLALKLHAVSRVASDRG